MELSKRMLAVAKMVPPGHVAADVGCDHGFVAIYLVENGICPKVYAADVRSGPLERAKEHIRQHGLENRIMAVLSDGLKNVPVCEGSGIDGMIAAGIGGKLTIKILSDVPEKIQGLSWLVLEPQSEVWLVRKWLRENGFVIWDEDMVLEDGKYYPVILAKRGAGPEGMEIIRSETKVDGTACRSGNEQQETLFAQWKAAGLTEELYQKACDIYGERLISKRSFVLFDYLEHNLEKDRGLLAQLPQVQESESEEATMRILRRRKELEERIFLTDAVLACVSK